jgi:hypothetical protein
MASITYAMTTRRTRRVTAEIHGVGVIVKRVEGRRI